jgi:hypothetical protein
MHLSRRSYLILGAVLAAALVVTAATLANRTEAVTLPSGTALHVRLDQTLASNQNRSGDAFEATVAEPIVLDKKTVIPEGARVQGRVVEVRESGHLMGVSRLRLALDSVEVNGKSYEIQTTTTGRRGGSHKKRNWAFIGGGAGGGALIGAIAGGGKGALIGGPVGAGAGTAVAYFTGKKDVRLPAESRLTFELAQPVTINAKS